MRFIFLLIISAVLISCGGETQQSTKSVEDSSKQAYIDNPSAETANTYLDDLMKTIATSEDNSSKLSLLEEGYDIANKFKISGKSRSFLFSLLKESELGPKFNQYLFTMAEQMRSMGKNEASNVLYKSYLEKAPTGEHAKTAQAKLDPSITDIGNYILNTGENIFETGEGKSGINRKAALKYVDACEAYALAFPKQKDAPSYLFRAAEIAKSIRTIPKTLSLYDWIIRKYPNYEKAATSLFLKGFVIENEVKNDSLAEIYYMQFLNKYPQHELADDVKFLVENLGKTDEEILKMIENRRKENE